MSAIYELLKAFEHLARAGQAICENQPAQPVFIKQAPDNGLESDEESSGPFMSEDAIEQLRKSQLAADELVKGMWASQQQAVGDSLAGRMPQESGDMMMRGGMISEE